MKNYRTIATALFLIFVVSVIDCQAQDDQPILSEVNLSGNSLLGVGQIIAASAVTIGTTASIAGNVNLDEDLTVGDAVGDTLTVNAGTWSSPNLITWTAGGDININSGAFFLEQSTGNVGIGTTSPAASLHVATTGIGEEIIISSGTSTGASTENKLSFRVSPNINGAQIAGIKNGGNDLTSIRFRTIDGAYALQDRMTIDTGGAVGIGTTAPNGKFEVTTNAAWDQSSVYPFQFINLDPQGLECWGMSVQAGANSGTDNIFTLFDYSGNIDFVVKGDGLVNVGTPGIGGTLHANILAATTITDWTLGVPKDYDALTAINGIKNDEKGNIDHSTLPEIARVIMQATDTFTDIKRKDGTLIKRIPGSVPTVKKARTRIEQSTEEYIIYGEDGRIAKGVRDVTHVIPVTKTEAFQERIVDATAQTWEMVDRTREVPIEDDLTVETILEKNELVTDVADVVLETVQVSRIEEGRDIGMSISINQQAIRQLLVKIKVLEARVAKLEGL